MPKWATRSPEFEKAEELLTDVNDHAAEINLKDEYPVRITKIGAFGGS